jgi:hypothetical protein
MDSVRNAADRSPAALPAPPYCGKRTTRAPALRGRFAAVLRFALFLPVAFFFVVFLRFVAMYHLG